ncbi:uncharacterized protein C9orf85 homolog [Aricia agestis]|uniref:uncharacterized protein C9orf85 homolog n=1 Tax=Aricia agestis TaxID=91739 RepID=UPI001C205E4E|nr:uncharacterized protein C9orf85 homolog [Aricia agestis]
MNSELKILSLQVIFESRGVLISEIYNFIALNYIQLRMSCSKGNTKRTRPQKHQNRSAFKNDLHDSSKQTKFLNTMEISGVCSRCKEIIEWRIKYKKYKPLTSPKKCIGCEQKNIRYAYHILCSGCASAKKVCSKCNRDLTICENELKEETKEKGSTENVDLQPMLKNLPERKRRTILRHLNKSSDGQNDSKINRLLSDMEKFSIDEDWSSDNLSDSGCEE